MSGSRTIIADADDRLSNVHPGDVLREDFLVGSEVTVAEVVDGSGLSADKLEGLLATDARVDAEIDLRLSRYFGMSEGFFLGLQNDYDLEEARTTHGAALAMIVRRAA